MMLFIELQEKRYQKKFTINIINKKEEPNGSFFCGLYVIKFYRNRISKSEALEVKLLALTRKFLSALGIEADKVDEIITAHTDTVDALKEQRDKLKADADKLQTVQKELDELKKASEGQDGTNPFEVKYNELVKEYEQYKLDVEAKQVKANKESAYRKLLADVGVSEKRIDSILKVTDLDGYTLDENGKFTDEQKAVESIKSEWADFIVTTQKQGVNTATPPNNNGQKSTMTRADILAIKDGSERRKAIAENPSLFGLE